jgi:hypothetical protein
MHWSLGQHTEQQAQNSGSSCPNASVQSAHTSTEFAVTNPHTPSEISPLSLLDSKPIAAAKRRKYLTFENDFCTQNACRFITMTGALELTELLQILKVIRYRPRKLILEQI